MHKISSFQSCPDRHCYHEAKKTKILVARMLCLLRFSPLFFIFSFSSLGEKLGARMCPGHDFLRLLLLESVIVFTASTQQDFFSLCCRHATRRCRSPSSCTAATTPPRATCCFIWSGLVRLLTVTPRERLLQVDSSVVLWSCLTLIFFPSSTRVYAVSAERKIRQRRQNVQQVWHKCLTYHFLNFLIMHVQCIHFKKTRYKQKWKEMKKNTTVIVSIPLQLCVVVCVCKCENIFYFLTSFFSFWY